MGNEEKNVVRIKTGTILDKVDSDGFLRFYEMNGNREDMLAELDSQISFLKRQVKDKILGNTVKDNVTTIIN